MLLFEWIHAPRVCLNGILQRRKIEHALSQSARASQAFATGESKLLEGPKTQYEFGG